MTLPHASIAVLVPAVNRRGAIVAMALALSGCGGGGAPVPAALPASIVPDPDVTAADEPVRRKVGSARGDVIYKPDSFRAWGRYGMVLDAHGFDEEAIACYRAASELAPGDWRWPYLEGTLLMVDDAQAALGPLARAATLQTDMPLLHAVHGDMLVRADRADEARDAYDAALAIDPTHRQALLGVAELALRDDDLETARTCLEQASRIEFADREVHAKLARLYDGLGDPVAAERESLLVKAYPDPAPVADVARAAVAREAVSARARTDRGLALVARGEYAAAEAELRAALELRPDSIRSRLSLTEAVLRQGRLDEAEQTGRVTVEVAPGDPDAHNQLAVVLVLLGRFDEAETHLDRALAIDPDHVGARFNVGMLRERQGRTVEAAAAYLRVLELDPVHIDAHLGLALNFEAAGNDADALPHWRDAFEFGGPADAAVQAAFAHGRRGEFEEASLILRDAVARHPDHAASLAARATILATCPIAAQRDGAEAVRLARRLVRLTGRGHADALNLLAAALAESGAFDEAVETAREALQLAREAGSPELAVRIEQRLELYEAGRPYHQGPP